METKRARFRALGQMPRHMISGVEVRQETETEASSRCYMAMMITLSDGTSHVHHAGRYIDRFVKVGERWLFAERNIKVDRDVDFPGRTVPPGE
jgi:3-phenylpropionate/cinnamic acid dioxygenase small subunit